jgi:hypothetical protein
MEVALKMAGIDTYTKLCLHMDGDQSDSNHTVTINGTPKLNSTIKKIGASSMYFDGSSEYLTLAAHADWLFGTGDFTVDFWVRFSSLPSSFYFFQVDDNKLYMKRAGGNLYLSRDAGTLIVTEPWTPTLDTWYHIAVARSGSTNKLFIDGSEVDSSTDGASMGASDAVLNIAAHSTPAFYFHGFIDEFRITKGEARWTEAFTPPTSAYTSDANTKLLLHFDGDESDSAHETTFHGPPKMNATTTKFNGAYYFDGTDYLSIPDHDDWAFGNGSFTIDCWVNATAIIGHWQCIYHQTDNSKYQRFMYNSVNIRFDEYGGLGTVIEGTYSMNTGVWYHLALVRNVNSWNIYIDGVSLVNTTDTSTLSNIIGDLEIGRETAGTADYFTGYIDELRISKGIARWTENFDVPTEAYTEAPTTAFKVKGTRSETSRIIVFDESDWSIEVNTVVSGSGAYEVETTDTGDRTIIARASDGEIVGYGGITPIEE